MKEKIKQIINRIELGDLAYHDKKRGYGTRYAGKSKEAAMKAFNK